MGWDRDAPIMTCGEWEDKYQPEFERLRTENAKLRAENENLRQDIISLLRRLSDDR